MAFHLGSLGFLTPFQFHNFQEQVTNVLEGHAALTLRSRLRCIIVRKHMERKDSQDSGSDQQLEHSSTANNNASYTSNQHQQLAAAHQLPSTNILVLNEVVIDRGPSPYLSNIDLFLDGKHITSVQGDGEFELFFIALFTRNYHHRYYIFCCFFLFATPIIVLLFFGWLTNFSD